MSRKGRGLAMILKRQDLLNDAGGFADEAALASLANTGAAKQLDPSQWLKDAYNQKDTYNQQATTMLDDREADQQPEDKMATTTLPNPFAATAAPVQPSTNIFNPAGTVNIAPAPIQTPANTAPRLQTQAASAEGGRRLVVGPGISLGGEISTCDVLVIEGAVAATLKDCKQIEISQGGQFKGNAEIDNAIIAGSYEGNLTVRGVLHLAPGARVTGSLRYAQLIVEAGAEINGELQSLHAQTAARPAAAPNGKAQRGGAYYANPAAAGSSF